MKRYIILAAKIHNMGGAQNYLRSKLNTLKKDNWAVTILYYQKGDVLINDLKTDSCYIQELMHPTYFYSKKKRRCVADKIIKLIESECYEQVIIESTLVEVASWGEYVASIIGAKHIVYSLQEIDVITNNSLQQFLIFKHKRRELAGITDSSIMHMFATFNHIIPRDQSYVLLAYNTLPLADFDYDLCDKLSAGNYDYIIGSVGRLDKPFVIPTVKQLIDYISSDYKHNYALVFIGDDNPEQVTRSFIVDECSKYSNISLYITGYLFPIPIGLIRMLDLNISSAGSARLSFILGIPTISIDGRDAMPIGILGYNTNNRLFRENEPIKPLKELLDVVLVEGIVGKTPPQPLPEVDYSSHFDFINNSVNSQEYYDIDSLCWNRNQRIKGLLIKILGPLTCDRLSVLYNN